MTSYLWNAIAQDNILSLWQEVHNVQPQTELVMGKTETYWPANSLAKAKRIDENEMITYSFEVEYCIKRLLLEYHSGENY